MGRGEKGRRPRLNVTARRAATVTTVYAEKPRRAAVCPRAKPVDRGGCVSG